MNLSAYPVKGFAMPTKAERDAKTRKIFGLTAVTIFLGAGAVVAPHMSAKGHQAAAYHTRVIFVGHARRHATG